MLVKNVLVPLLGLAIAAEAVSVQSYRSAPGDGLVRRQFKGKFNNQGNNNQGKNQGNNNQNNQNNNQGKNQGNNNQNNQNNQNNNQGKNQGNNNQNNNNNGQNNNNQASATCLAPNAIQTGSQQTGQNGQVADGQVESAVDQANFINFCAGQVLTNGLQNRDGSCNGIPMGKIPSVNNMVSSVITFPLNFQVLPPEQTFTVRLQVNNLNLGSFTNATSTYYTAPQNVAGNGNIIGHTHITVQDAGNSINPVQPLDARQFVFFKGVNDAGNGQGGLQVEVTGGLPEGFYRFCTMSSASNHQPVLMPVAQRGFSEDCRYAAVSNNPNILANQLPGANAGGGNNNNNQGNNNQGNNNQNNNQGNNNQNNNQGKNQGNNQQNNNQGNNQQNNQQNNNQGKNQGNNQQNNNQQNNQGKNQGNNNQNNNQGKNQGNNQQNNNDAQAKGKQNQQGNQNNAARGAGGALGGIAAPQVQNVGGDRAFVVNGNSFVNEAAAIQRACAIQNNACANAANSGAAFSVQDCSQQEQACQAAARK